MVAGNADTDTFGNGIGAGASRAGLDQFVAGAEQADQRLPGDSHVPGVGGSGGDERARRQQGAR